jgi:hypothetical protein
VRLTWVLYKALLVEGVSLESAMLRARHALHSEWGKATEEDVGDSDGTLPADAYALQLDAHSRELFLDEDGSEMLRQVRATFPVATTGGRAYLLRAITPYYVHRRET